MLGFTNRHHCRGSLHLALYFWNIRANICPSKRVSKRGGAKGAACSIDPLKQSLFSFVLNFIVP